ncbi:MAG: lytic transglycosylase domain-containing protein [Muribaculaceae bacterium]|nr:lytic transglycosylase domain-containing protein [Muribaculaceae bacterium]
MNRKTIYISIAASLATAAALVSLSPQTEAAGQADDAVEEALATGEFSTVISPVVPASMDFAGKQISFDRTDMYEKLDRELTSMTYTHGNTMLMIKRANRFFPILAPILKKNGIPLDMLYLAAIESNLSIRAYSPAKAAGLWQFMPSTAKQFGLEVNEYVDERYHIEKSTQAACRYLKQAMTKYGNWESVAASYNGGMARISSEMDKQLVDNALDLYLVEETTRYPFRIMAAKLIMENPVKYGFRLSADQLYQPIQCKEVIVNSPVEDWPTWAADHGITFAQLREVNPWIRATSLPNKTGKTYQVKVPEKSSLYRSKQKTTVYNPNWIVR